MTTSKKSKFLNHFNSEYVKGVIYSYIFFFLPRAGNCVLNKNDSRCSLGRHIVEIPLKMETQACVACFVLWFLQIFHVSFVFEIVFHQSVRACHGNIFLLLFRENSETDE